MNAKLKNQILNACKIIKARKRNKLNKLSGLCSAIYDACLLTLHRDVDYDTIINLVSQVAEENNWEMDRYIDPPYKWTRKRRLLLDKLIEVLESEVVKKRSSSKLRKIRK